MKKFFNNLKNFFLKKNNSEKKKNLKKNIKIEKELKKNNEFEKISQEIEEKLKRSLIILDKKSGKTSADEVYDLRRILNLGKKYKNIKIGHSGTLDPKVTGVLVLGLGSGTKALEYILLSKKIYETEIIFHKKISRKDFVKALDKFTGTITQLPPVKSAVKREKRKREVYDLKLTFFSSDGRSAKFVSSVEKGTYIRTLCHDMGIFLNTGAHMGELRRIVAGSFSLKNANIINTEKVKILYNSKKIEDKKELLRYFYNIEEIFLRLEKGNKMKKIIINNDSEKYIKAGNPIRNKNLYIEKNKELFLKKEEIVSIFNSKNNILAIGVVVKEVSFKNDDLEKEIIFIKKNFL